MRIFFTVVVVGVLNLMVDKKNHSKELLHNCAVWIVALCNVN